MLDHWSPAQLVQWYHANRWRAHESLFARRHEDETPEFHRQLIADFWNDDPRRVIIGFRGCGKSTRAEEYVIIGAVDPIGQPLFRNCVFIGPSETRAAERLAAVSNELKTNDHLDAVYGSMVSEPWTQTKIQLKDGRVIQAMGREQDMRGMKHLDWRPDLVIVDDFEDKDNVLTPEGRRKTLRWFLRELRLACDPRCRIIVLCTIMDPDCVPLQLIKAGWPASEYPIAYLGEQGDSQPIWPHRFPAEWIERTQAEYRQLGEADIWDMEMMCERVNPGTRVFSTSQIRIEPVEHTFQAKYVMIDPARTVRRQSAMTGWAVWSWERNRLIVWDGGAAHLMPDEIVDLAFRLNEQHQPIDIGIEETGLNEWLSQPIRSAMLERGSIPYRAVQAPRGKLDFIRGLQPFFAAGNVVFARDLPEMRDQLLGFPTGRIDAPNALAYALLLKPGRLVYDEWNVLAHVAPKSVMPGLCYLAANATRGMVSGVVVQFHDGRVVVLADFLAEGDPEQAIESVLRQASMFSGRGLTIVAGVRHFDQWTNVGLVQAIRNLGPEVRPGGSVEAGKSFIRQQLERLPPGISVSPDATWTLRAFAGGYSRPMHHGLIADEAENNRYRVLMEGIESLCGLLSYETMNEERNYSFDRIGRPYLSIIPNRENVSA